MNDKLPSFWSFNRSRDSHLIQLEELIWQGPYSWYGFEKLNQLEPIPDIAGVYLITFEYQNGYILRYAGVTSSMKRRFSQHKKFYLSGQYTLLDVPSANKGERLERWRGWEYAKNHQDEYLANIDLIRGLAIQQLTHYRMFVTQTSDRRKRERIEFSIIHHVYASQEVLGDLVDRGMALRGRFNNEMPIRIKNHCDHKIYGLPEEIEM